jgi:hypothetical protein
MSSLDEFLAYVCTVLHVDDVARVVVEVECRGGGVPPVGELPAHDGNTTPCCYDNFPKTPKLILHERTIEHTPRCP